MILSLFHVPSKKEEDMRNRIGGWFWSTFQKVQIINELELLYASFMLSLCYCLCGFYTDYASTKRQYYVGGFMLLIIYHTHLNKKEDPRNGMGGLVWSTL